MLFILYYRQMKINFLFPHKWFVKIKIQCEDHVHLILMNIYQKGAPSSSTHY